MIQMSGMKLSERAMRQQIASAIHLVIQVARMSDGARRVTSISEMLGAERKGIRMQEIFRYERQGVDQQGHVIGNFRPNGVVPQFLERLGVCGLSLSEALFDSRRL
jgi:pilus assembly protein CpaF